MEEDGIWLFIKISEANREEYGRTKLVVKKSIKQYKRRGDER